MLSPMGGCSLAEQNSMDHTPSLFMDHAPSLCLTIHIVPPKAKMVSASSASAIKQVCRGTMDCAIHDKADMAYEYMCKRLDC